MTGKFNVGWCVVIGLLASCAPVAPKADAGPTAEPLRIVGRHDVMEVGPVLYAVATTGPDHATFRSGGVDNLFKQDGDAAGTAGGFDHATGSADIAAQAETQALRASLANPDLRIILTVSEGLYRIVARRSAGIGNPADLRGKRIGVFERTSAAFFLDRLMAREGVSVDAVTRVPLRPREMEPALREGRVDAIAIWEPESERAVRSLGKDAVSFSDPATYRELYNLNTTAAALNDPARRARIVAFVRTTIAATRVAQDRPDQIWPLLANSSGYPAELIAASWKHHRFPGMLPDDLLDMLVIEEEWLAAETGREPRGRAQLARLIDRSVLKEALAGK